MSKLIPGWRDHIPSRRLDFRAKWEEMYDVHSPLARAQWQVSYGKEYRHHTRYFMGCAHRLALRFVEACAGRWPFLG